MLEQDEQRPLPQTALDTLQRIQASFTYEHGDGSITQYTIERPTGALPYEGKVREDEVVNGTYRKISLKESGSWYTSVIYDEKLPNGTVVKTRLYDASEGPIKLIIDAMAVGQPRTIVKGEYESDGTLRFISLEISRMLGNKYTRLMEKISESEGEHNQHDTEVQNEKTLQELNDDLINMYLTNPTALQNAVKKVIDLGKVEATSEIEESFAGKIVWMLFYSHVNSDEISQDQKDEIGTYLTQALATKAKLLFSENEMTRCIDGPFISSLEREKFEEVLIKAYAHYEFVASITRQIFDSSLEHSSRYSLEFTPTSDHDGFTVTMKPFLDDSELQEEQMLRLHNGTSFRYRMYDYTLRADNEIMALSVQNALRKEDARTITAPISIDRKNLRKIMLVNDPKQWATVKENLGIGFQENSLPTSSDET